MNIFSKATLVLGVLSAALSVNTLAATNTNIYDTDGLGVQSHYNQGPVTHVTGSSYSARHLSLYIFSPSVDSSCISANAYDLDSGDFIVNAPINQADIKGTTLLLQMQFPEDALQRNKEIRMNCYGDDGAPFTVMHKMPGAPSIEWTSNLQPSGAWTPAPGCERAHCNSGFGHYESLNYQSTITVNNHADNGLCYVEQDQNLELGLFHGRDYREDFHSDVFVNNQTINAYNPPVILQKISCQNSTGTTSYIQVWDVSTEDVRLIEDYSYIQ